MVTALLILMAAFLVGMVIALACMPLVFEVGKKEPQVTEGVMCTECGTQVTGFRAFMENGALELETRCHKCKAYVEATASFSATTQYNGAPITGADTHVPVCACGAPYKGFRAAIKRGNTLLLECRCQKCQGHVLATAEVLRTTRVARTQSPVSVARALGF